MFGLARCSLCCATTVSNFTRPIVSHVPRIIERNTCTRLEFFGQFHSRITCRDFIRFYSRTNDGVSKVTTEDLSQIYSANEEFQPIYRFPYIKGAVLLSRLKVYQSILTVVFIPICAWQYSAGAVGLISLQLSFGVSCFALCMLYIMSSFFRKLVGVISMTSDGKYVRMGHMTFWGKRTSTFIPVNNIVPFSEIPDHVSDVYLKLKTYDSPKVYYMSLKYGQIVNAEKFTRVFGKVMWENRLWNK